MAGEEPMGERQARWLQAVVDLAVAMSGAVGDAQALAEAAKAARAMFPGVCHFRCAASRRSQRL